ncbi:protein phosphatase 2A structural subunit [Batrachochytrium dendrobatidis]|nr:protein phosphatase 2A structural subunit [Batrachochytrium dendrobatidis]
MNSEPTDDALYPIAVLIDELKHDDVVLRLNAIRRLSTIALALGPERTRDELIPFLDESVDDEDEILLALAEELGGFVDYVGGPHYAHILFTPLENLAAVEETVVREKAIDSAAKIVVTLSQHQIEEFYLPMLKRLSTGDWFTSRTSACGLYASAYPLVSPTHQDELRTLYSQLCNDDTPMVRRAAATCLAKFTRALSKPHVISSLLPFFNSLAQDEQDSVRLLTVESLISIAEIMQPEECKQHLLTVLRSLCADKSWRVRYMIADKFISVDIHGSIRCNYSC